MRKRDKEIKLLHKIIEIISSTWELKDILSQVVTLVTDVTRADGCLLYVHDPKTDELILRASKNPHPKVLGRIRIPVGEGITGWVASQKKPVAIARNASNDQRFKFFHSLPEDRYEAFLSVPILMRAKNTGISNEEVIGVINAQHKKPRHHHQSEINTLLAIGRLVGKAIEHARISEESEKKSQKILKLEDDLKTRKLVEQAKGILMKSQQLSEEEAFRHIQKESMRLRRTMKDIAQAILITQKMGSTQQS